MNSSLHRGASSEVSWEIREGDALARLREMPDESVQCCITSPPYFGLRDYGVDGQLGLEESPAEYVEALVAVFREVRRVLRSDGTVWLNLGDSYGRTAGPRNGNFGRCAKGIGIPARSGDSRNRFDGIKDKDLLGIPWMVAFALRADGWWLRSDIIWAKPNPMPASVTDRPTNAHEHIFLLARSARYYYDADAIREPDKGLDHARTVLEGQPSLSASVGSPHHGLRTVAGRDGLGRNKRNVWEVNTQPFPEAHFATFPPKLIEPCVLAGAPAGATVLDPFAGSGTTGLVALRHGRGFVGLELNPTYAEMARERIRRDAPLLNHSLEAVA